MHRFLLVMLLLFDLNTHAQIDQKKLDSLSKSIDSSAKAFRTRQDRFVKIQDSIYQTSVDKSIENSAYSSNQILPEQRTLETKERKRTLLRVLVGVVLVVIGVVMWFRKRKTKT